MVVFCPSPAASIHLFFRYASRNSRLILFRLTALFNFFFDTDIITCAGTSPAWGI